MSEGVRFAILERSRLASLRVAQQNNAQPIAVDGVFDCHSRKSRCGLYGHISDE